MELGLFLLLLIPLAFMPEFGTDDDGGEDSETPGRQTLEDHGSVSLFSSDDWDMAPAEYSATSGGSSAGYGDDSDDGGDWDNEADGAEVEEEWRVTNPETAPWDESAAEVQADRQGEKDGPADPHDSEAGESDEAVQDAQTEPEGPGRGEDVSNAGARDTGDPGDEGREDDEAEKQSEQRDDRKDQGKERARRLPDQAADQAHANWDDHHPDQAPRIEEISRSPDGFAEIAGFVPGSDVLEIELERGENARNIEVYVETSDDGQDTEIYIGADLVAVLVGTPDANLSDLRFVQT